MEVLHSFDDIRLLNVELSRLPRWYRDGLLCIGDAAHAMSPVGGIGINLAVQDAVAAGRILAEPLRHGHVVIRSLRKVQRRRWAADGADADFPAGRASVRRRDPHHRRGSSATTDDGPCSAQTDAAVSCTAGGSGLLRRHRPAAGTCAGFRPSEGHRRAVGAAPCHAGATSPRTWSVIV